MCDLDCFQHLFLVHIVLKSLHCNTTESYTAFTKLKLIMKVDLLITAMDYTTHDSSGFMNTDIHENQRLSRLVGNLNANHNPAFKYSKHNSMVG